MGVAVGPALEHPLDDTFHHVLAALIQHAMVEGYDAAIALAGRARPGDLNDHAHGIAGEQGAFEGHRIDTDQRETDVVDTSAENNQALGKREDQRARREAFRIERFVRDVFVAHEELLEEAAESDELRYFGVTDGPPHGLDPIANLPVLEAPRVHLVKFPSARVDFKTCERPGTVCRY